MKGVDDLDFFIGDEAIDKPTYATKVISRNSTHFSVALNMTVVLLWKQVLIVKINVLAHVLLSLHAVAHQARYRRGLGSNGEVHGAGHL